MHRGPGERCVGMTAELVDPLLDGDPVLLSRVRAGDSDAYGQLFERHRGAAVAFAGRLAGPRHAEDLVAEAFAKVLDALQRDLGPTVSFRSYLLTSIRSIWNNTIRTERRYDLVDSYEQLPPVDALTVSDDPDRRFDNGAVAAAYRGLPERWQAVLWYTAVEGLPHSEVAVHLGIKPNAVAALSFRAREGLRQAYLAAHLGSTSNEACLLWAPLLPAYARGALDRRKRPGLEAHVDGCLSCTAALADLDDVNNRLGAVLLPAVLGAALLGSSASWTSLIGHGGAPAVTGNAGGVVAAGKIGLLATLVAAAAGAALALPLLVDGTLRDQPPAASSPITRPEPLALPERPAPTARSDRPPRTPSPSATAPRATATPTAPPVPVRTAARLPRGSSPSGAAPAPPALPTALPTEPPTDPPDPTEPPDPTVSPSLSRDIGFGTPSVTPGGDGEVRFSTVRLPVNNVRASATVSVTISNLLGRPVRVSSGWDCPGTVGSVSGGADLVPSTTVVCTWTGSETGRAELRLSVLTAGPSVLTASVRQAPGIVDPVAANNTVSVTITP
jgi:RNA polymerase sigma factor (sigma-70 family)